LPKEVLDEFRMEVIKKEYQAVSELKNRVDYLFTEDSSNPMVGEGFLHSVLPHIGQNYATIPTQNMHFVKGNQRLKLIAANATSSFKMRFRYQRF